MNLKVLWITNTLFPAPSIAMGLKPPVLGGWMYGLARLVAEQSNINLAVASCVPNIVYRKDEIDGITYHTIPLINNSRYPKELESYWKLVCEEFKPDIIHIHGTEYPRALACMKAFPQCKYIVSLQGIIGPYSRYILGGIANSDIITNITFKDIITNDTLFQKKYRWHKYAKIENEYFNIADAIIGRTNWDFSHSKAANKSCAYFFCNENLRDEFYQAEKWTFSACSKQTIFLSQAGSPIKGLHKVVEAIQLIKDDYPNLKIRVAGNNITDNTSFSARIKRSGYGKYIKSLINKHNLFSCVEFLGSLDAENMINEYQNANVFICPSSIENSPNSIGEAQIIGTPVIASYTGGIPDMVTHNETGLLYRFEEVEMLAENIRKVFTNNVVCNKLSKNSIRAAEERHDRNTNLNILLKIYETVLNRHV
jgi:L-malate glycosyltransferase